MMRVRQLRPVWRVRGPTGSVAGGTGHIAETRGRLDIFLGWAIWQSIAYAVAWLFA
jgi:hypothetical protein